ncbi:MAG: LuxR C-terminal-related transcriptional regulator [Anaerolineae bacterium]
MDTPASGQADWLAQTKLHPPLLHEDVIPRPRLLDALHHALTSYPLTLVSAPAGYGKTTLLSDFGFRISDFGLGRTDDDQIRNPQSAIRNRVAWLTLDEEDNDTTRFLTALIAALRRLNPACGTTAQAVLAGLPSPGAEARRIVGVLINDVLETLPDPFALILDDLHLITESTVFVALDYLLEHLPPQMHLAVGTRQDPLLALARLRARGQLAELRLPDLRFTPEETTAFLNDQLHLGLSPADLTALHDRTEGWPAGLRLLAGSLERIPSPADRTAFIQNLAQTDRHVFSFLAEEVLNHQEPATRTFLLETSILSELTPALCQAVTGRADAGEVLEEVYRRNLFVVAVGPQEEERGKGKKGTGESLVALFPYQLFPSYRYHALFAEFLRRRLAREMPERMPDLHRRAAEAQRGTPSRAIRHYLAAEMWEEAAQTIEEVGGQLLQQGLVNALTGWIHALPAPAREARPRLAYLLGICAWQKGDLDTAQSLLEEARRGFEAAGDEAAQGEVLAEMASCAFLQADFERGAALSDGALARPLSPHTRLQSLMGRSSLALMRGDWAQAEADFEAARAITQESADPDVLGLLIMRLNPSYALLPGGVDHMERICHQARAHFGDQVSPMRLIIEELTALIHLWRGRLEEAIRVGESALAIKERLGGSLFMGADAAAILAGAHVARGDYAAAEPFYDLVLQGLKQEALAGITMPAFLFVLGRGYWLQGRLEEARQMYAQMCAAENPRELPMASVFRAQMSGLLAMAEERYDDAERAFRRAVSLQQEERVSVVFGNPRVMLAHLYLGQNRPEEALVELAPALAECERQGTPGFILSYGAAAVPVLRLAVERGVHPTFAAHLLDLLGVSEEPRAVRVPETGEILTPREVEVLRLIATGDSNRQIAEQLVISEHTVKTHVHHILRKLGVATRTEAAARTRTLRLI